MLGQLILGFKQDTTAYVFSALIGFCLVFANLLLGAGWLVMFRRGFATQGRGLGAGQFVADRLRGGGNLGGHAMGQSSYF